LKYFELTTFADVFAPPLTTFIFFSVAFHIGSSHSYQKYFM